MHHGRFWIEAAAVCAAVCGMWAMSARGEAADERRAYEGYVAAGEYEKALATGDRVLDGIRAAHPGSKAIAMLDEQLTAIRDARLLVVYKVDMIADGAASAHPSPFLYVTPTAAQLYRSARQNTVGQALPRGELSGEEAAFAESCVDTAVRAADKAVIEAYMRVKGAGIGETGEAKARAYVSAYLMGLHNDRTLPGAIALAGERIAGGGLPVFLADDALGALGDVRSCGRVLDMLDDVTWAGWPEGEEARVCKAMAKAAETGGEYDWAVLAYRKIAEKGTEADAEVALAAVIRTVADRVRNYAEAARACGEYLRRFADGEGAVTTEYLKAMYEWKAGDLDRALADVKAFGQRRPDSALMPEAVMLEGLIHGSQKRIDDAVACYRRFLERYPKHSAAGKAQFLIGFTYLLDSRYKEAQEALQRVVDFYPGDPYVDQARKYLKAMPTPRRQ